jgi:hypothetical protein
MPKKVKKMQLMKISLTTKENIRRPQNYERKSHPANVRAKKQEKTTKETKYLTTEKLKKWHSF